MKVKVYVFPFYANPRTISPRLFNFLDCERVDIQVEGWDGTLKGIPTDSDTPGIIQASYIVETPITKLGKLCAELGHLIIYHDGVILSDGTIDWLYPADELVKFLDRVAKKSS